MGAFEENAWDADDTGDKLSKELFQKRKSKKNKKKEQTTNRDINNAGQLQKNAETELQVSVDLDNPEKDNETHKRKKKKLKKERMTDADSHGKLSTKKPNTQEDDVKTITDNIITMHQRVERNKKNKKKARLDESSHGPEDTESTVINDKKHSMTVQGEKLSNGYADNNAANIIEVQKSIDSLTQQIKDNIEAQSKSQLRKAQKKAKLQENIDQSIAQEKEADEDKNKSKKKKKKKKKSSNIERDSITIENEKAIKIQKVEQIKEKKIAAQTMTHKSPMTDSSLTANNDSKSKGSRKLNVEKIKEMLAAKQKQDSGTSSKSKQPQSLRDRMMNQLRASRFRYLNEQLYNSKSFESKNYFKEDPEAFKAYHEGYKKQVEQWPLNPLDLIIDSIKKMSKDFVIADFGCGEARLAKSVPQEVHSFDLVAINDNVKACDMAHTPLLTNGIHVVVFCLSLMGTNLNDYLIEANRVLKKDGLLKIAEVESRFDKVEDFIKILENYGFVNTWKDLSHNLFYFMDFKKVKDINRNDKKLPPLSLKPCLYKKR
ncbi:ribosomal RNA-processing protein 8 [Cephus cinctus]|uniref:Ribosomal RNA-processing protein 8 n=1 Tax=Cephus cinctus TaxID=211228 RepID=A0AAJ7FM67_CEPCN|nr:ribosomal RNA-processing protein 8 [Cephus cinctus]XP_015598710.1 ribosomal RNA-processing protein 8 [Cephus cinctus]XP_015598711.1 ribosomal RNA-processing protein 8 [Cephus cinctus]XP_015598712.1 ribosomal RNA-processing protein 8 [Cephus cinctus]XP_015598713.1 ribosomal RNA-processing protein 8 [Cephus cinctus]